MVHEDIQTIENEMIPRGGGVWCGTGQLAVKGTTGLMLVGATNSSATTTYSLKTSGISMSV